MNLGGLIRKARKDKKLTLKVVSYRAGISEGFLSQVENNVSSPSVDKLVSICNAIGINAGDLLNEINHFEKCVVIRKDDWAEFEPPRVGFLTRRFFPPENRDIIDSTVMAINPGVSIPVRKNLKNAQEVLCVLRGTLELIIGDRTFSLNEGDCVHYWSNPDTQQVTNRSDDLVIVLWVGTI